jgi:hypothetical protein
MKAPTKKLVEAIRFALPCIEREAAFWGDDPEAKPWWMLCEAFAEYNASIADDAEPVTSRWLLAQPGWSRDSDDVEAICRGRLCYWPSDRELHVRDLDGDHLALLLRDPTRGQMRRVLESLEAKP